VSVCSILRHSASLRPQPGTSYVFSDPPLLYLGSCGESKLNIVPSLADISTGKRQESPLSRGGESLFVPRELLERVYWSQHQTVQQVNNNVKD